MCLAIPMRLEERDEFSGRVSLNDVSRQISLMLFPEAEVGQWLLVHAGYAISAIDEDQAQETLALLAEYSGEMMEL